MIRRFLSGLFLLCFSKCCFAQAAAAGEISYTCLGNLSYNFRIIIWADSVNQYDDLLIDFGSASYTLTQVSANNMANVLPAAYPNYWKLEYQCMYSFSGPSGPGGYDILATFQHYSSNITNLPGSGAYPLTLKAHILVDPAIGNNSAPVFSNDLLLFFPVMQQNNNYWFGPYDPDNDSLAYVLIPTMAPGFIAPDVAGGGILSANAASDNISWNAPQQAGVYNQLVRIEQWKRFQNAYLMIGYTTREVEFIVDHQNSIAENTGSEVHTYPNPAISGGTLHLDGNTNMEEISIYSTDGNLRWRRSLLPNEKSVLLPELATGYYLCVMRNDAGEIYTQPLLMLSE